ncbi:MAG: hypothetical protein JWO67_6940 [Streptosporangiaceae bacterium]|nr:hypothetical protein [Streptosporangiaceae bacterium]
MIVEHLRDGQLDYELGKCDELRNPPVPVWAWLSLDGREWAGDLYGWAANPNGADDGWRGLVGGVREFAPGFGAEFLGWVPAEHIRQRGH